MEGLHQGEPGRQGNMGEYPTDHLQPLSLFWAPEVLHRHPPQLLVVVLPPLPPPPPPPLLLVLLLLLLLLAPLPPLPVANSSEPKHVAL